MDLSFGDDCGLETQTWNSYWTFAYFGLGLDDDHEYGLLCIGLLPWTWALLIWTNVLDLWTLLYALYHGRDEWTIYESWTMKMDLVDLWTLNQALDLT